MTGKWKVKVKLRGREGHLKRPQKRKRGLVGYKTFRQAGGQDTTECELALVTFQIMSRRLEFPIANSPVVDARFTLPLPSTVTVEFELRSLDICNKALPALIAVSKVHLHIGYGYKAA